jgi:hypothetical protein
MHYVLLIFLVIFLVVIDPVCFVAAKIPTPFYPPWAFLPGGGVAALVIYGHR